MGLQSDWLLSKRASALALEKTRTWSSGNNKALLWFITILCDCIRQLSVENGE
jgi:hypothetical protein